MKQALIQFKPGDQIKIMNLDCGQAFAKRLCELGVFNGMAIEIIKNDKFGPLIIKIFDSRIALGRGQASKIYGQQI